MSSQEGISQDQTVDPGIDSDLATANLLDTLLRHAECSDFEKLVERADLGYLLRYPELQTLFAPLNGSIPQDIRTAEIEELVQGQMLRRAVQSYDLTLLPEIETNAGKRVPVVRSGTARSGVSNPLSDSITLGGVQIVRADIPCTNGVIHIVDRPLPFRKGKTTMPSPASPGTNQFRCNACGRYFNTASELRQHETECRAAKIATPEGARELRAQDSEPHQPNDGESKQARFQHGTRPSEQTGLGASGDGTPTYEEISVRAYEFWQDRGRPSGSPEVDWNRAVEELRSKSLAGARTRSARAGQS